jgi:hypothetical protein
MAAGLGVLSHVHLDVSFDLFAIGWIPIGLELKKPFFLAVLLFGVLLPAWWADRALRDGDPPGGSKGDFLPLAGPMFAILLLSSAFAVRLFRLTTLSSWPLFDEGVCGFAALDLTRGAPRGLLYGNSQAPPALFWALESAFRLLGVSLGTLWLVPALLSFLFVPLAWWAARRWYPPQAAAFLAALAALSFWPMLVGRYCVVTVTLLPAMALALGAMGLAFRGGAGPGAAGRWALFGASLGAGFYTHLPWLAFAPMLILAVIVAARRRVDPLRPRWAAFLVPLVLLPVPLFLSAAREGVGAYVAQLWALRPGMDPWAQARLAWDYVAALFWGVDPDRCTYQPVWGGLLNPVLASLVLLGGMGALRRIRESRNAWLVAASAAWLLPGILTDELEPFRLLLLMPVLFVFSWMGLVRLLGRDRAANRGIVLAVAAVSVLLDAAHLFVAYPARWETPRYWTGHAKSLARARAFRILEAKARAQGPGLLYTRFVPGLPDPTLELAAYAFNAADNPALPAYRCTWAAFLVNANYEDALKRVHPFGKGIPLDREGASPDGGWILFLAPLLDGSVRQALETWTKVQKDMTPYWRGAMNYVYGTDFARCVPLLRQAFRDVPKDPVLAALQAEVLADALFKAGILSGGPAGGAAGKPHGEAVEVLTKALQTGPPFAHLYVRLGQWRLFRGEPDLARRAFEAAAACPGDRTRAREYLENPGGVRDDERKTP